MIPLALTGARAILSVNGKRMAWAARATYQIDTRSDELRVVDMSTPAELAPGSIVVKATLSVIKVPRSSSATLMGIHANMNANLTHPYIQIEIRDRQTDETILVLPRCTMVRKSGGVGIRSLSTESWEFISIGYWDEMIPTEANDNSLIE